MSTTRPKLRRQLERGDNRHELVAIPINQSDDDI